VEIVEIVMIVIQGQPRQKVSDTSLQPKKLDMMAHTFHPSYV
jgi:hypothetical protein